MQHAYIIECQRQGSLIGTNAFLTIRRSRKESAIRLHLTALLHNVVPSFSVVLWNVLCHVQEDFTVYVTERLITFAKIVFFL